LQRAEGDTSRDDTGIRRSRRDRRRMKREEEKKRERESRTEREKREAEEGDLDGRLQGVGEAGDGRGLAKTRRATGQGR
jgi:hypothetical protein